MTVYEAAFTEATGQQRAESVPLSHLSLELGHLYFEDLRGDPEALRRKFEAVAPWAQAVLRPGARISTCYLIDDYFSSELSPADVVPLVLDAAKQAGLNIGYLARESACASVDGIGVADLVTQWIIDEPPEGSNGLRPPATVVGWLANGKRSPTTVTAAMKGPPEWQPPRESARNRHSIFLDIELWSTAGDRRLWSCPMLAAVWQLARLGLLRYEGKAVLQPHTWEKEWPVEWASLPGVIKVDPGAAPFSAYRTLSVLDIQFLPVEHAVRQILGMVAVDASVMRQSVLRAGKEGLAVSDEIVGRVGYVFVN
ncbi:MAG TPA: SCO2522 family protein [Candidatus Limnocylindrales bacterium]|nr:SCO2522 family protein [Candidatus Limnocylindrales bacterium]